MGQPKPWGVLLAISLHDCHPDKLDDPDLLQQFVSSLIKRIKMKPHGKCLIDRFGHGQLYGLSAMQFIETSTITVHIDKPGQRVFIDIFSCKDFDAKGARRFCQEFFQAGRIISTRLLR